MTEEELEEVVGDFPTLYHMAERGSWESIRSRGLLSTTALLDLYSISGERRKQIESMRRPKNIEIVAEGLPRAVIRDQHPMTDRGLERCLGDGLSPSEWYRLLNGKVFFWVDKGRLLRMLDAGTYRDEEHDVLEVDTGKIIAAHRGRLSFSPMNSGCTQPFPHPRDLSTFRRIEDYRYAERRKRGRDRVVEVAFDYSIPDVQAFTRRVVVMKGDEERGVIWPK